jgi:hypothetical protein
VFIFILADPFNRAPLNISMVEPVPELKQRYVTNYGIYLSAHL